MLDEQMTKKFNLKQTLIKAEITDKHYDINRFFKYCSEKKLNGNNLDQWTLLEINELVVSFIKIEKLKEKQKEELEDYEILNKSLTDNHNCEIKVKDNNIKSKEDQIINLENIPILITNESTIGKIIQCDILQPSELNYKSLTVKVDNPSLNEAKIFELNYITYEVVTEEMKWMVKRRNSDFEWLRAIMSKYFPCSYIPPLPKKKKGKGENYISKRMKIIQHFISEIAQNESFKATEALVDFLSIQDRPYFEAKMKGLNSVQSSATVQELKTLSGKIIIKDKYEDHEQEEKYYNNLGNFFEMEYKLFKRLKWNLQKYNTNLHEASIFLEEASKDFKLLYLLNEKVMMKDEITQAYHELSLFCNDWRKIQQKQNSLIELHLIDFFKYVKMEGLAFSELLSNREEIYNKYKTEENKLNAKKEVLWNGRDTNKWDMINDTNLINLERQSLLNDKQLAFNKMCTKKTEVVQRLYDQLGYANMTLMEELNQHISSLIMRYESNIKTFTTNLYPTLTDLITVWTGLTTFVNK